MLRLRININLCSALLVSVAHLFRPALFFPSFVCNLLLCSFLASCAFCFSSVDPCLVIAFHFSSQLVSTVTIYRNIDSHLGYVFVKRSIMMCSNDPILRIRNFRPPSCARLFMPHAVCLHTHVHENINKQNGLNGPRSLFVPSPTATNIWSGFVDR